MKKSKALKRLKKCDPITHKMSMDFMTAGFVTGSVAFGQPTAESDIDLLLEVKDPEETFNHLMENNYAIYGPDYRDRGQVNCYVKTEADEVLNLIIFKMGSPEFKAWVAATTVLRVISRIDGLIDILGPNRKKRIALFEAVRDLFR